MNVKSWLFIIFLSGLTMVLVPAGAAQEDSCEGYLVQYGDVLDLIAQQQDVALPALREANDLQPGDPIFHGDCLTIPTGAPGYGEPLVTSAGQGGGGFSGELYVVQPRDTLDTIGQAFDVSVEALRASNGIEAGAILQPGKTLVIPADAPPYGQVPAASTGAAVGRLYEVREGETLADIAERLNVSLAALEFVNGVNDGRNALPGTTIVIPEGAPPFGTDEFDEQALLGQGGGAAGSVHVVQRGEMLDTIAAFYNRDAQCLIDSNGLQQPGRLTPGQVLVIDESCGEYSGTYIPPLRPAPTPEAAASGDDA